MTAVPGRGRVIGVDLGAKRVGIAVCDSGQHLATAATTLVRTGDRPRERRQLVDLVEEYEAVGVVFGLPRSLSGDLGPAARGVLEEIEALRPLLAVPVDTVDERLTTVAAAGALQAAGRRTRQQRSVIDQVAAAVLLQSWLDRRASDGEARPTDRQPAGMEHPRT
jgi:putative Holliday junction resolvase